MRGEEKLGSHVGMILSFVIFITFIVFLYSVIRPTIQTGEDKKTMVGDIENAIMENLSANLTTATASINKNDKDPCIELGSFLLDIQSSFFIDPQSSISDVYLRAIVKEGTGDIVNSANDDWPDLAISRKDPNNNFFFKVFFSPKFGKLSTGQCPCGRIYFFSPLKCAIAKGDYILGSIDTGQYIYLGQSANNDGVYSLVNYYNSNYEKLKTQLKITPGNEFWFSFIQSDGTVISPNPKSAPQASIYVDRTPVQYFDSNANLLSGFLEVRVW